MLMGEDRVGELVEAGPADQVLHTPKDPRTLEYVRGRWAEPPGSAARDKGGPSVADLALHCGCANFRKS